MTLGMPSIIRPFDQWFSVINSKKGSKNSKWGSMQVLRRFANSDEQIYMLKYLMANLVADHQDNSK